MKKSLFLLIILLLALSGCSNADMPALEEMLQAEVIQGETEIPDDYILTSNADNYVYTPQESPDAAVPSSLRIVLNGEPLVIDGLEIDGQMYFRMDEIARMLQGTRAEFDFFTAPHWDPTDIDISWRWNFDSSRKFHGIEDARPVAIEGGIAVPTNVSLRTSMARDGWRSEVSAFEVNGDFYFDLNNLGYILGYIHRIENGIVHINTMEPGISEYGFIAARDFLSALPTLFTGDWTDEIRGATPPYYRDWWREGNYTFPFSYRLYDFNNDGIPEIVMRYEWCADDALWGIHVLYAYENGDFVRVGTLSYWGELFMDGQGNFYSLEGSHQEGFARIVHFGFTDEGVFWEVFAERGVRIWELPESEQIPLLEQAETIWEQVSFSPPSFKGVPLTVVRPFELPELFEAAAQNSILQESAALTMIRH